MIEFCCDKRKVSRDINCIRTEIAQVKFVAIKISMSKQTSQLATKTKEENSVATEIAQESKKSCRDIENSIAIEIF